MNFQVQINEKQTLFTVFKLNTVQAALFTYHPENFDWYTGPFNSNSICSDYQECPFHKDIWSINFEEITLVHGNELAKRIARGHSLLCLHSYGFCKSTLKHSYTVARFLEEKSLIFHFPAFIGRMSKLNNRYWFETNEFLNTTGKITEKIFRGMSPTVIPYINLPLRTTAPNLSRLKVFPRKDIFCTKPTQMYTTQYLDNIVVHRESFETNTGN